MTWRRRRIPGQHEAAGLRPSLGRHDRIFVIRYVDAESPLEPYVFAEFADAEAAEVASEDGFLESFNYRQMLADPRRRAALLAWEQGNDSRRRRSLQMLQKVRSPQWNFGG